MWCLCQGWCLHCRPRGNILIESVSGIKRYTEFRHQYLNWRSQTDASLFFNITYNCISVTDLFPSFRPSRGTTCTVFYLFGIRLPWCRWWDWRSQFWTKNESWFVYKWTFERKILKLMQDQLKILLERTSDSVLRILGYRFLQVQQGKESSS